MSAIHGHVTGFLMLCLKITKVDRIKRIRSSSPISPGNPAKLANPSPSSLATRVKVAPEFSFNQLHDFLNQSEFYETGGAAVPLKSFLREFIKYLDDDERIMAWLQFQRIEKALTAAGFPIGRVGVLGSRPDQAMGVFIGNLAGPGSRRVSDVPLVFDDDLAYAARPVNALWIRAGVLLI